MRPNTEGRSYALLPQLSGTDFGVSWLIRIRWLTNHLIHNAPDNNKSASAIADALFIVIGG